MTQLFQILKPLLYPEINLPRTLNTLASFRVHAKVFIAFTKSYFDKSLYSKFLY
jgi:hypothetical protein